MFVFWSFLLFLLLFNRPIILFFLSLTLSLFPFPLTIFLSLSLSFCLIFFASNSWTILTTGRQSFSLSPTLHSLKFHSNLLPDNQVLDLQILSVWVNVSEWSKRVICSWLGSKFRTHTKSVVSQTLDQQNLKRVDSQFNWHVHLDPFHFTTTEAAAILGTFHSLPSLPILFFLNLSAN